MSLLSCHLLVLFVNTFDPTVNIIPPIKQPPCLEFKESVLTSSVSFPYRVKELTVDPNQVMEGGRPNIHTVNQLDLLDDEWLSISPQRDDLKLLCEQNVSTQSVLC